MFVCVRKRTRVRVGVCACRRMRLCIVKWFLHLNLIVYTNKSMSIFFFNYLDFDI